MNLMIVKSEKQKEGYRFDESTVNISQEREEVNHLRIIKSFQYK
jgi:hypothetical protein